MMEIGNTGPTGGITSSTWERTEQRVGGSWARFRPQAFGYVWKSLPDWWDWKVASCTAWPLRFGTDRRLGIVPGRSRNSQWKAGPPPSVWLPLFTSMAP